MRVGVAVRVDVEVGVGVGVRVNVGVGVGVGTTLGLYCFKMIGRYTRSMAGEMRTVTVTTHGDPSMLKFGE